MAIKSRTCVGRASGKPLDEYASEREALEGAQYVRTEYGKSMVAYGCGKCRGWHLSPADRRTPSTSPTCGCRGSDGRPKATYESEGDAQRRAEILEDEQGVRLRTYDCEHGAWHLTKDW